MSWGPRPSFIHALPEPTRQDLAPGTTPACPSAPPCQMVGQPGVLPSSEPFPPQHLGMEDAEHRPGLRRELRRRVLRCSR